MRKCLSAIHLILVCITKRKTPESHSNKPPKKTSTAAKLRRSSSVQQFDAEPHKLPFLRIVPLESI